MFQSFLFFVIFVVFCPSFAFLPLCLVHPHAYKLPTQWGYRQKKKLGKPPYSYLRKREGDQKSMGNKVPWKTGMLSYAQNYFTLVFYLCP